MQEGGWCPDSILPAHLCLPVLAVRPGRQVQAGRPGLTGQDRQAREPLDIDRNELRGAMSKGAS